MKALIQKDGRVAQIVNDSETFPVHQDLIWVDCDDTIRAEHTYNHTDNSFIEPEDIGMSASEIEAERVEGLREVAITAELIKLADVENGVTLEAIAWRQERDEQLS